MLASFSPADWEWLHDREEKSDIDCLWPRWIKQFFDEISRFIPVASPVYSPRKKSLLWLTYQLRRLISFKNKMYRRAVRVASSDAWTEYCKVRIKCTNAIKAAKADNNRRQAKVLADPSCNATTWRKVACALCGFDKRSNTTEISPLQTDIGHKKFILNDGEKADLPNDVRYVNQTTLYIPPS